MLWFTGNNYVKYRWHTSLPRALPVERVLVTSTDWIEPPGGGCGGAIFRLSPKTAKRIEIEGLPYFDDASTSRNGNIKYVWSKTASRDDTRFHLAFSCILKKANRLGKVKGLGVRLEETVFTYLGEVKSKPKTRILVIPSSRLVLVGYWD